MAHKDPAARKAYKAKWRAENREARKRANAKWRAENPEKVKTYNTKHGAKYYAKNREAVQASIAKRRRTSKGWSNHHAGDHRRRVRLHNSSHPDRPLAEKIITGPLLLHRILEHGPRCGLCKVETGWPWDHVGLETGPEVDHIQCKWQVIAEGRDDWAAPHNIRLLCVLCHAEDGERTRREEIEMEENIARSSAKDLT